MSKFYDQLKEREAYLTSLKSDLEEKLKNSPQGNLRISKSRGKPRYYVVKEKHDTHGKYISKKEIDLAKILAKKDYTNKLLKAITEEYSYLKKYRAAYEQNKLEDIYDHLNEYRKLNLIKLEEYRSSGIYFGKNLIVTFEAEGVYLNIKEIRNMAKEIFGIRN